MAFTIPGSIEPPQQHTQPSRKGKKAWRKNVDVSEVQAGLEEARKEVIQGGIIAEKSSDDLFTLDTTGSEAIQRTYNKTNKPLKADQILAQRSAVPAISSHKRPRGVSDGVLVPSSKKRKSDGVSPAEYERLRQVAFTNGSIKDVIRNEDTPDHDPWALKPDDGAQDPRFSYLERKKPIVAPRTLKEAPISLVVGGKEVPAVAKPKPGTSYNPVFDEWDALLTAEGEKEVAAEKKRLEQARLEKEREERIAAADRERERNEAEQTEDESAWEGFESDYDAVESKAKRPERKTPTERKRAERKKERERAERILKKSREKDKAEKRISEIRRQVDRALEAKNTASSIAASGSTDEEADEAMLRRRRLGKAEVPQKPLELVLPDELQESLRLLKPEGNLLKDRFRSILVRGKMETRKPIQQAKKKRRTYTEKWTYKDFAVAQ